MRKTRIAAWRQLTMVGLLLGACEGANDDELWEPRATVVQPLLEDAFWAVATLTDPTLPCPDLLAQSWASEGTRMFDDATLGLAQQETDPADLPDPLRGFCLYRWVGATGAPVLPVEPTIRHVSLDWAVVEAMGNGLQSAYRPALRDVLLAQAGRVWSQAPQPTFPVTVGVVDSEPEHGEGAPYIDHGSSMALVIEALACPSKAEACRVQPYRALALPLLETGEVRSDGGYYGTRAHVAMGIVEAVLAWRKSVAEGDVSRLVINLSLGWVTDGGVGCGLGEDEPWCEAGGLSHADELHGWLSTPSPLAYSGQVANEAVHAALLYATCQGALVVAAAGNAKDDSCNEQPVAPAAWSRYASPSEAECVQLGFEAPEDLGPWGVYDANRPLVQAVSAVDHGDAPIFLSRPGTETRLVAPGHMATTGDAMEPLTGTSISAAVVTAGAALSWAYDPEPSAGAVVDRLYASASSLGRSSQLMESGGSGVDVRRISLCHAVDPTCDGDGECTEAFCDPEGSMPMALDALRMEVDQQTAQITPMPMTATGLLTESCWSCGEPITAMLPTVSSTESFYFFSSCGTSPAAFVPEAGPTLAGPQPDDPPCPDCPFIASLDPGGSHAILALDSWYWNRPISGATLTLRRQGYPTTVLDLTTTPNLVPELQQGHMVRVTLPGIWHSALEPMQQVSLGLMVDAGGFPQFRSNELLLVTQG